MLKIISRLCAALLLGSLASTFAHAQARTFVASAGTDANPCSVAAPCRTLQRGIDAVAAGGDVLIVDSGGFGSNVMITKSVSVIAPPGGQSRIAVATNQTGITIDAAGISVSLSGLGISGTGPGAYGVSFVNGTALSLSGMDINVVGSSVAVNHAAGGANLTVHDTVLRRSSVCFVAAGLSSAPARATIVNVRADHCSVGFFASTYSTVAIDSTSASGTNCSYGFTAMSEGAVMTLNDVVATNCSFGIYTTTASLSVSNSLLTGNGVAGESFSTPVGRSYGNNRIFGNTTNALNGFTSIAEQ